MNVLITGGTGYIGSALVKELASKNEVTTITIYDNLSGGNRNLFLITNPLLEGKIKFMQCDILDTRNLKKALQDIDVVYHLAAKVGKANSNSDAHFYEQTNHWGTAELVYAIVQSTTVKKFIYVSSTSVYGKSETELAENNATINPLDFYSISKSRGEQHVQRLGSKISTTIVRCGSVYGYNPSMRLDNGINKMMFEAQFNHKITIDGGGKQRRTFIHIDRVSNMLSHLLSNNEPSGIYNLTDKNIQMIDVLDVLKQIYPDMEFMFINQHIAMDSLVVNPHSQLTKYFTLPQSTLLEELIVFKSKFGFSVL
jgi:UDP-glucose 4-epimerase